MLRRVQLDRISCLWVTRSGHRSLWLADNGGAGDYKWEAAAVANTSRDLAFRESFQPYCVDGLATSRLGQVTCP